MSKLGAYFHKQELGRAFIAACNTYEFITNRMVEDDHSKLVDKFWDHLDNGQYRAAWDIVEYISNYNFDSAEVM